MKNTHAKTIFQNPDGLKSYFFFLQNYKNIKWKHKRMFILESLVGNVLFRKNAKT